MWLVWGQTTHRIGPSCSSGPFAVDRDGACGWDRCRGPASTNGLRLTTYPLPRYQAYVEPLNPEFWQQRHITRDKITAVAEAALTRRNALQDSLEKGGVGSKAVYTSQARPV